MPPRILVVYYSRTGHTERVARRLAEALGDADLEPIHDRAHRAGPLGFLRSAYQAVTRALVDLEPATHDPRDYDLVVIGTPVWGAMPASPVRSYLWRHRDVLPELAFFCTCGGRGSDKTFAELARLADDKPLATLALREDQLAGAAAACESFAATLRATLTERQGARGRAPVPVTGPDATARA
jgi:flavodoxin